MRVKGKQIARIFQYVALFAVGTSLILIASPSCAAQSLRVRIRVDSISPAKIAIDLETSIATDRLSFRNAYAGVIGLGERIENLRANGTNGEPISMRKLAPGEFKATASFRQFSYDVTLNPRLQPAQMSHVSWLDHDHGLLMLGDLLPNGESHAALPAVIRFDLPARWTVASNVNKVTAQQYSTAEPDKAVFVIGTSLSERSKRIASTDVSVNLAGEWPFSDADLATLSGKIIEHYRRITGFKLREKAVLVLLPFPGEFGPERWTAETRGNCSVILLGRQASAERLLAQLGVVLTHELFHLWVPNSLKLDGDYDWFFEGFTLYEALLTDLRLGLISFDDFLGTIGRVYDSYLSSVDRERLSLIEASERRWTASSSLVSDKGLLVAFIYDLRRRNSSKGAASIDTLYRELFRRASMGQKQANDIIISLLNEPRGFDQFSRYVASTDEIELDSLLPTYGMGVKRAGLRTQLLVRDELNKEQRKLLASFGYRQPK